MWYVNKVRFIRVQQWDKRRKENNFIMKKKLLTMLLCASMLFTITACGDGKDNNTEGGKEIVTPTLTKLAEFDDVDAILTGDYEVTDKKIAEGFTSFANNLGVAIEWIEIKDRDTIQKGDIVKLDYTGYLKGEAFSGGSAKDQWINVSKNCSVDATTAAAGSSFIDGFCDGLIGAKVGETVKHDVTFPENYGSETLNGQLTTFEFKIHGIYTYETKTLENINDEFVVKNFADYELKTVDELKKYIKESLTYNSFLTYIVDKSEFDISDEYVEYRTDMFVDYQKASLVSMYGESMTIDTYLYYMYGCKLEDIRPTWKKSIENQIKYELVYDAIVSQNGLEPDEEKIEAEILKNLGDKASEETLEEYYQYIGAGDKANGKAYLMNENKVRELLEAKLGFDTAE